MTIVTFKIALDDCADSETAIKQAYARLREVNVQQITNNEYRDIMPDVDMQPFFKFRGKSK